MKYPLKTCVQRRFKKSLQNTGPAGTLVRVCSSDHLDDLQWIAFVTAICWCVFAVVFLVGLTHHGMTSGFSDVLKAIDDKGMTFAGVTATAAAILNWAYQTGSNRLGAIDLFACEISTICRVSIVIDFANDCIERFNLSDSLAPAQVDLNSKESSGFTSEENYTPVYNDNLSELEPLDADVLTAVTEFYTYRKTMVDYLRRLAILPSGSLPHRECAVQMIYMQFLMYESAHKAIQRLMEFEPNRSESLINIFCSELVLYRFLLDYYSQDKDCRYQRLLMREKCYRIEVPALLNRIASARSDHHWERAKTTASELDTRFQEAFA